MSGYNQEGGSIDMVDNYPLTIDSNTEIEPLDSVRDVRMRGQSVTQDRVANIPQMTGATASTNGGAGVVPAPNVADRDKYLKGDGTWAEVSASGSNVQVTQVLSEGTKIATISVDDVRTDIFAPEGGGTVTDVVDGDGTSLVDENGVAHVLGEVTDVVDANNFSLVNNNVAKIPFEVDSTICSPIPDYANMTDIEESRYWTSNVTYTWTAPCDCLLVPVVNNDVDFVEYTIGNFTLYSAWNNDSISTVNSFPISNELIPLAKDTQISIKFLHRYNANVSLKYRYIPFKRLQTNRESYPQPYLNYNASSIVTVSTTQLTEGFTAPTDGVFIAAYTNPNSSPLTCYINEMTTDNKYFYMATGNTPNSSMRLGAGDTIRIYASSLSGNGWFLPFATTDDPTAVYMPVPDYSDTTTYTDVTIPQSIPRGFLFNDYRHTTTETTSSLSTMLMLRTETINLNLTTISPVPSYETDRYSSVSWFSMSGTETFDNFISATIPGEILEGSFIHIPYSTQNILVESHFNVDDVVDGEGNSLVDANGIAHVTAKVKDVLYDDVSVVNDDGVAELFTQIKPTILPLLDYENEVAISASTSWRDTTVRKWTAPCDCVFYIFDQAGTTNTFVRYGIGDFVYYGTCMSQNHSAPYGLLSNMIPLKKGQEISIQFQGQMMNNYYTKAYYIPYKTIDESAESFPLPYLDHNNRISIDYSTTSFTAPTDGMVVDYGNSVHSIVVHTDVSDSTFYGKGGSQYFDCSIPLSAGDNVTLGTGSGKYFIPFKRTTNINRLVSPIPDYANRVTYTGNNLPTSFSEPGFLFLCAHDYTQYSSSASATYNINSQVSLDINAYKYNAYWKDSFAPVDETMIKSYVSTGTDINYYFIPYSEFNTVYVKDILVGGASVVGDGSVARIESLVTDVQLNGESLVSDGGVANVTGKVFDVQLEGISILDNNEVANIKTPILTAISPVLDYANAQYITESATWKDRNEHTWTAPCDCAIWYSAPNSSSSSYVKYTIGTFKYETYRTAYGAYNNINLSNYESMLPVAEGTTVTIQFNGTIDSTGNDPRLQYIPYKKLTSLQSDFPQPYLSYANKISVEWTDPVSNGDLICRYTAPTDGIFIPNLNYNVSQVPLMRYYVNDPSKTGTHTTAYTNYFTNGVIIGKGDVIELYDVNSATSYQYTGTIEFIPFARTNLISSMVSPIPDYANAEVLDTSDMPSTFSAGYLFNCKNGTSAAVCTVALTNSESDTIKIVSNIGGGASGTNRFTKNAFLPLNGTETLSSFTDGGTEGDISLVPYSNVVVTPVLVSDVKVNGTSVVDTNGVANITGAGGSTVTVTQIQSTGTKIAEIDVDGTTTDLYAPNGGGGGSTVSVNQKVSSGENIASITVDGVTTELYATNTTYSDFDGATSQAAGTHGLVPVPTTSDTAKFLKGDGSWGTPDSGSDVSVTQIQSTGTKIATVTIDNVDTDIYAPNGGGGGSTVSINRKVSTGENFADITIDGVTTQLYATDTTYNDYSGATSQAAGTHGLVPSATTSEKDMFLKGDGSWDTPDAGSDVSVTQILSSGTKLGTITVDNVDTDLYAPTPTTYSDFVGTDGTAAGTHGLVPAPTASDTNKYLKSDGTWATVSGGGGATDLDDLSDVDITTPSNGQVLKYNSTSQKWENGTGGGGASDLDDLTDVDITSPTSGQILKYNGTTQKWENVDTGGTASSIFSSFDTLMLSERYASGTLSTRFNFSMSETADDWSTSATIYNNTAIDITSYDEIEIDVTITDQTDSGAFWVTLSTTKYTWSGYQWPTIYANVDSAIKITETGIYTIDTSNLSGDYYIYVGGTTGKSTVTHGDCVNTNNGGITGYVSAINGIASGNNIIPNPQGTPTDTLETIEINGTIYDIAGNGGEKDYVKKKYVYTLTVGGSWEYFTNPQSENPLLIEAVGGGAIKSYRVDADSLPTYESYTTIGTDVFNHPINMCKTSNGNLGISVNDPSISGETVKVYEVIGYSIEADNIVKIYDSGNNTTPATMNTDITYIDGIDISNYDLIVAAYSSDRGSVSFPQTIYATGIIDEILNDTDNDWVVAGYGERWAMLDIGATSFRVTAGSYGIYKLFAVKLSGGGNANIEELTQAQYDALPTAQKNNDTLYLTYDPNSEVDLTVRMDGYTSTSGTASAVDSYNDSFLAWHAFASEDDFNSAVIGEYWCGKVDGYLQFDFDEVVNISKLSFASYGSNVTFDVMYSTDGTTYSLAERIVQNTPTSTPTRADIILTNTLENCVSIRLVCVSFTGANGGTIGAFHIYGNYGSTTPNRIYRNGKKYSEFTNKEIVSYVGLTKEEYDLLPSLKKHDETALYLVDDTGIEVVDMSDITKYIETNSNITTTDHKTTLIWDGGAVMGQTWYYNDLIDLTDIVKIKYNLKIGSASYGSTHTHDDIRNLGIGVRATAPSAVTLINSMNFAANNEYHDVNDLDKTLIGEELDVSGLTGEYYLIGTAAGWRAEISNITLISGDGVNKKYVYWDDTVYGESRSDNLVGDELTLSEYNQLPIVTKNDGKVRFIPHSDVGASQAVDMTTQGFYENPSNMNVTDTTSTKTTITWAGGVQIGCSYYYTTAIDVTDWDMITFDVQTGSCYGGGASAAQPDWDFIIGLLDYEITSAVNLPASSSAWKAVADLTDSNHNYSGTELNVSNLTGELYLTVVCHGWNATVENITLLTLGGYSSRIKYMSETYGAANIEELTEGDYQALTNIEKNNGTVYFTYDGGYKYISALDGKIIVRVNTSDPTDCLWFFNGFVATGLDNTVPTELTTYLPSSSGAVASKGYGTSEATTQVSWIGFYGGNIRSWTINWNAGYVGTIYGVVDITSGQHQDNGYQDAYTYPTATPTVPNHIYMNSRCYTSYKPRVSFLYWASGFDSTITLDEDIRNFDRIMIFTSGGKPFTCDPRDYFNGNQEYFGVGIASNKYVWYSVGSDGKTLTSAYHDGLDITMILGLNDIDTDCPWGSSHDH